MVRRTFPGSQTFRAATALLMCLFLAAPAFANSDTEATANGSENAGPEGQALRSLSNEAMNRLLMNIGPPRVSPSYAGGCDGISGGPNCASSCYTRSCRDDPDCKRKGCTSCNVDIIVPGLPKPPFAKCS